MNAVVETRTNVPALIGIRSTPLRCRAFLHAWRIPRDEWLPELSLGVSFLRVAPDYVRQRHVRRHLLDWGWIEPGE